MLINHVNRQLISLLLMLCTLTACFQPPFNQFQPQPTNFKAVAPLTGIGALTGLLIGSTVMSTVVGAAIGGSAGTIVSLYRTSKFSILSELQKDDIQFVQYGDTMTLIIPTDHYFLFNSAALNETCYAGLNNIIRLMRFYPCHRIYVAGFTDNVGSSKSKQIRSQKQAEAIVTFLWANGVPAHYLYAQGYGDQHTLGDNHFTRGSAYNRRIEIQWLNQPTKEQPSMLSRVFK